MVSKTSKALRMIVMTMLALLILQYEFGIVVTLADPAAIAPFGLSLAKLSTALNGAGVAAVIHAGLGTFLAIFAVAGLVLSLRSGIGAVQVFGVLAFITVVLAVVNGILFVLSGYQNDGVSHGMASMFILTYTFYFLEFYYLKPAPRTPKS